MIPSALHAATPRVGGASVGPAVGWAVSAGIGDCSVGTLATSVGFSGRGEGIEVAGPTQLRNVKARNTKRS